MRWVIASLAVVAATVAATTALLLGYSARRNDPVGRLSPVANLHTPAPATPTVTVHGESDD
jgi:hypothetical protein